MTNSYNSLDNNNILIIQCQTGLFGPILVLKNLDRDVVNYFTKYSRLFISKNNIDQWYNISIGSCGGIMPSAYELFTK